MVLSRAFVWPVVGAIVLLGCGRDGARKTDSAASERARSAASSRGPASACPKTGHWTDCQVKLRLEQSGLAPQVASDPLKDLPTLSGTPTSYHIGAAGLAVYLFSDSAARSRAAATLDTTKFIPPGKPVGMQGEATAIVNDNVLALLFSRNEHQRERVADAITAGPPQP